MRPMPAMPRLPALLLPAFLLTLPANAQEAGPNLSGAALAEPASPGPVRTLVLAWDLHAEGLRREDPMLVLTAIRLARTSSPRTATGWISEVASAEAAPSDAATVPGLPRDPASPEAATLAALMAEGNPDLADLTEEVLGSLSRGRPGEGRLPTVTGRIDPGGRDVYRIPFNGELPAEVALIGDGTGNLDLTVTDETGHRICAETGPSDRAYCGFVPLWNGWFDVTVTNPGTAPATYRLSTN
jgi:hypothetical protein